MNKSTTLNLSQIPEAAGKIVKELKGGEIFGLVGTLGAGKTTFVKAVGKALKMKHLIPSPTFILLQAFEAKLKSKKVLIYHLDLYRTNGFKEAKSLGLTEFWGRPNTVTFIEWADKIKKYLPKKTKVIKFKN